MEGCCTSFIDFRAAPVIYWRSLSCPDMTASKVVFQVHIRCLGKMPQLCLRLPDIVDKKCVSVQLPL